MVAAWAAVAADRPGSRATLAFATVGFAAVVLILAHRGDDSGSASLPLLGYAAALGSALAMAFYTLAVGRLATRRSELLLTATLAGGAVAVPAAVAQGDPWQPASAILLGVYTGQGPMAAGYALWTYAMSDPSGARLASIA
jgi:drug/metabolite transporter (DMT)-like permease